MTKIRNYRIPWRVHEIARHYKKLTQNEMTPDVAQVLEDIIASAKTLVEPSALFETYPLQSFPSSLSNLPLPSKAVGCSLIAVTLGEKLTQLPLKWETCLKSEDRQPVFASLYSEALRQSVLFISKLIQDQAKEEDCLVSPVLPMAPSDEQVSSELLQAERIGLSTSSVSFEYPTQQIAWLFWWPQSRQAAKQVVQAAELAREALLQPA